MSACSLRHRLFAGASIAALLTNIAAPLALAAPPLGLNDNKTTTPIKHVIIIVGENRSFDHLFGTYVSPSGDKVDNILAKDIVAADGTPGPHFRKARQVQASDTTTYSVSPTITGPYGALPPPNLNFTPNQQSYTAPPFISVQVAQQYDYGLLPADMKTLTTGASGLPFQTVDTRIAHPRISAPAPISFPPA